MDRYLLNLTSRVRSSTVRRSDCRLRSDVPAKSADSDRHTSFGCGIGAVLALATIAGPHARHCVVLHEAGPLRFIHAVVCRRRRWSRSHRCRCATGGSSGADVRFKCERTQDGAYAARVMVHDGRWHGDRVYLSQEGMLGRRSRAVRARRDDPNHEAERRAKNLARRALKVRPSLDEYERAARTDGKELVSFAVVQREVRLSEAVRIVTQDMQEAALSVLAPLPRMDTALQGLGADYDARPLVPHGSWEDQMRWGVDSAAHCVRLSLAGQVVGAAAITRQQLDRWTANLASSTGVVRTENEPTPAYYRRVWAVYGEPPIDPGDAYAALSELLHARGPLVTGAHHEAALFPRPVPAPVWDAYRLVLATTKLALRQVRGCVATRADELGRADMSRLARTGPETFVPSGYGPHLPSASSPLLFESLQQLNEGLRPVARGYHHALRGHAAWTSDEDELTRLVLDAYLERRYRAAAWAATSFEREQAVYGEAFDAGPLGARIARYWFIGGLCALVSRWEGGQPSNALAVAASALRSAWWLWLEDAPVSMKLARTVLEGAAQARAFRLRPDKAQALHERSPGVRTGRWTDLAGWRRTSGLNVALSEFSHIGIGSRWDAAVEALARFVEDDDAAPSDPVQLARGNALEIVALLLAHELGERLATVAPALATEFRSWLHGSADTSNIVDDLLSTVHGRRTTDLGESEWVAVKQRPSRESA